MDALKSVIKNEPIRVYSFLKALLALAVYFFTDIPADLILSILVPLLGLDEVVRAAVTPVGKADSRITEAYVHGMARGYRDPDIG